MGDMNNVSPPETSYYNNLLSLLPQLDGNISISSSFDDYNVSSNCHSPTHPSAGYDPLPISGKIPTVVGFRPQKVQNVRPLPCLKRIRQDNKVIQGLSLPRIINYNMRSLIPKLNNFALDMNERESDIGTGAVVMLE